MTNCIAPMFHDTYQDVSGWKLDTVPPETKTNSNTKYLQYVKHTYNYIIYICSELHTYYIILHTNFLVVPNLNDKSICSSGSSVYAEPVTCTTRRSSCAAKSKSLSRMAHGNGNSGSKWWVYWENMGKSGINMELITWRYKHPPKYVEILLDFDEWLPPRWGRYGFPAFFPAAFLRFFGSWKATHNPLGKVQNASQNITCGGFLKEGYPQD